MARCKLISYIRVSTKGQGQSGLGLEAQQAAVAQYQAQTGCDLIAEYREVESGKKSDRPELVKALAHAKRAGATLVFAKLDRLARNTRFLLTIIESGADVVFCDFPSIPSGAAGKFMLSMLASVAELEAGLISERTKAALAAYKARGGTLGGKRENAHTFTDSDRIRAGKLAGAIHKAHADEAYGDLAPKMLTWREEGCTLQGIADKLNQDGETTRKGAKWNKVQVGRVLARCGVS